MVRCKILMDKVRKHGVDALEELCDKDPVTKRCLMKAVKWGEEIEKREDLKPEQKMTIVTLPEGAVRPLIREKDEEVKEGVIKKIKKTVKKRPEGITDFRPGPGYKKQEDGLTYKKDITGKDINGMIFKEREEQDKLSSKDLTEERLITELKNFGIDPSEYNRLDLCIESTYRPGRPTRIDVKTKEKIEKIASKYKTSPHTIAKRLRTHCRKLIEEEVESKELTQQIEETFKRRDEYVRSKRNLKTLKLRDNWNATGGIKLAVEEGPKEQATCPCCGKPAPQVVKWTCCDLTPGEADVKAKELYETQIEENRIFFKERRDGNESANNKT